MSKNLKIWLGVIAISLSSSVIGGVATAFYIKHRVEGFIEKGPKGTRLMAMRILRRRLALSDRQVQEIRPSIKNAQKKLLELRHKHRPEIEEIINQAYLEINPKLEDRQKQEFDRLKSKFMKRFSNKIN